MNTATLLFVAGWVLLSAPAGEPPDPGSSDPSGPTPAAPAVDPSRLRAALARIDAGPSLGELQRAALRQAGVVPGQARRWRRRARVAAALPTLTVQYDHRLDQGWTLDREAGAADALRSDGGQQGVVRVKASWELDRLIFSADELRVARAAIDVDDWRTRVLVEVTALYFERQRLLLELELAPPTELEAAADSLIRLREIEGLLTALTGLDFDLDDGDEPRARRVFGPQRRG